ncbi:twin-arginine translocase TatA/TatE family subunit [Microbacterium proteolyticum]|uniref:twin-arginine translocase TatA/TatE family subunit n=1 Tax=Microbacterium proteolyticum TaxID=1572644 RepID=UPI001FAD009A|nr:twin-arginine translocase TatA/TatE family subunit [Microbacterium proteolyticum]MCI9857371.1 twin-arginine translocase TatA/TatE family subunit [Microbacterium proteolyticum]
MLQNLTGWHALVVLAIVVLVFGAAKLPALARSVGQSVRILRTEAAEPSPDDGPAPTVDDTPAHADSAAASPGSDIYELDGDGDGLACNGSR